jgi:hypothetical protein
MKALRQGCCCATNISSARLICDTLYFVESLYFRKSRKYSGHSLKSSTLRPLVAVELCLASMVFHSVLEASGTDPVTLAFTILSAVSSHFFDSRAYLALMLI